MELQDIILKSFAETVNKSSGMSPESRTLYGTVTEITDDIVYVKFDGADADTTTPTKSLVQVGVGDDGGELVDVKVFEHHFAEQKEECPGRGGAEEVEYQVSGGDPSGVFHAVKSMLYGFYLLEWQQTPR